MSSLKRLDHLKLKDNPTIQKLLRAFGDNSPSPETVLYSARIVKINRRNKSQRRVLLLTNKAVYNIKRKDYKEPKRRIDLNKIGSIAMSLISSEFSICVPLEYDYRFKAKDKKQQNEIIKSISNAYLAIKLKSLKIHKISQSSTIAYTVNKDVAALRTKYRVVRPPKPSIDQSSFDINMFTNKERTELLVFGWIRIVIEQIYKMFIPESIIILIIKIHFNPISLKEFLIHKLIARTSTGRIFKIEKKQSGNIHKLDKQYFAMKVHVKKKLKHFVVKNRIIQSRNILESLYFDQFPYIKHLHYTFQTKERLFEIYHHFDGGELFYHLKKKRRFSEDIARIWIAEISLAIGYLHSKKINIYGIDLKPENILLDLNGHCYLSDVYPVFQKLFSNGGSLVGTPEYLSPQLIMNADIDKNTDWWSVGILLYELIVGIPPFYSQNVNEMYRKIQEASLIFPPWASDSIKNLITKLLERDIKQRIGYHNDINDIMKHQFFRNMDWRKLKLKKVKSLYPIKIDVVDALDVQDNTKYIDMTLMSEEICYDITDEFNQFKTFIP